MSATFPTQWSLCSILPGCPSVVFLSVSWLSRLLSRLMSQDRSFEGWVDLEHVKEQWVEDGLPEEMCDWLESALPSLNVLIQRNSNSDEIPEVGGSGVRGFRKRVLIPNLCREEFPETIADSCQKSLRNCVCGWEVQRRYFCHVSSRFSQTSFPEKVPSL